MATSGTEFVAGWNVVQTLGEGAFGEVKLLINNVTGEAIAMKIVDLGRHPDAAEAVKKEICLHRMLRHQNVIKFYGCRKEDFMQYMFLEYASGGELFDRIEPDVGTPEFEAQKYFKDLINGVEYLHQQGVTHRDLKPENLLLDEHDTLKITDFGMATLFRYDGKERELSNKCGTKPYIAPEVFLRAYNAEPADIWSCGVILVALLAGELPWDEPTFSCPEFQTWKDKDGNFLSQTPWNKISNLALSLLRKVLNTSPRYRANISTIKKHAWFVKDFQKSPILSRVSSQTTPKASNPNKRMRSFLERSPTETMEDAAMRMACSQPAPPVAISKEVKKIDPANLSFSQPANPEQFFLSTQLTQGTQSHSSSQNPLQRLVKRMTRILVQTSCEDTARHLENAFEKLNYNFKFQTQNIITVSTADRRGAYLVFKASILDMGQHILVDFRLSKGCGLDFKRCFLNIKKELASISIKVPATFCMTLASTLSQV